MKADRDKVVPLIKTARGQLDGILKMIDEDRYCIDISNQVLAVISILGKANKEIIRAHLAGCVKDSLTGGTPEEVETKLDERSTVVKSPISLMGTSLSMVVRPLPAGSMPSTRPRRLLRSPMMSPV